VSHVRASVRRMAGLSRRSLFCHPCARVRLLGVLDALTGANGTRSLFSFAGLEDQWLDPVNYIIEVIKRALIVRSSARFARSSGNRLSHLRSMSSP
jgi:hypothetical protein